MATYEYKCTKCGEVFEATQKMSDAPLTQCPKCDGPIERLISGGTGLIFKGSGFYITDYKKTGTKKDTDKESPKTDSKDKSDTSVKKTSESSTPAPAPKPKTSE